MPACSLWPYKFVSQLLSRLVDRKAVNLQTNTQVTRISKNDTNGTSIVYTSRGPIKARKIVFATNGYTAGILPEYSERIIPVKGTASHIRPAKPIYPHLRNTYNIHYSPDRVDYLNPRPDGGIVVGGGKWLYESERSKWEGQWDDSTLLNEVGPHFEGLMQRNFKGWENSEATGFHMWTGFMGYTSDGLPHIGEIPGFEGRRYICAGFNGGGMSYIFTAARALAKMVLEDAKYEDTGLPRLFKTTRERLQSIEKN